VLTVKGKIQEFRKMWDHCFDDRQGRGMAPSPNWESGSTKRFNIKWRRGGKRTQSSDHGADEGHTWERFEGRTT